jgi:hypothetical protein
MNMNKTRRWTQKKNEKLEVEYEHGGWEVGNKEKKTRTPIMPKEFQTPTSQTYNMKTNKTIGE